MCALRSHDQSAFEDHHSVMVDLIVVLSGTAPAPRSLDVLARRLDETGRESVPQPDDDRTRADTASALAVGRYWEETVAVDASAGDVGAAGRRQLARDALAAAERVGDDDLRAVTQVRAALATWGFEPHAERRELADRALEQARSSGRRDVEIAARVVRATDHLRTWSLIDFHAEVAAVARVSDEDSTGLADWLVRLWRGTLSLVEGRLEQAEHDASEAFAAAEAVELPVRPRGQLLASLATLSMVRGTAAPPNDLDASVGTAVLPPSWALAAANRDARAGRLGPARHRFEQVAASGFAAVPRNMTWLTTTVLAVETASLLGDRERMMELDAALAPFADDVVVVGPGHAVWGPVSLATARAWSRLDEPWRAGDAAERAHAVVRTGPFGLLAEVELHRLGRVARRVSELRDEAALYGMTGVVSQLDDAAAVEGTAAASPTRPPVAAGDAARRHGLRLEAKRAIFDLIDRRLVVAASVGLGYLAVLLEQPGEEIHVLEVSSQFVSNASADPVLDRLARQRLREHLLELDEAIAVEHDPTRASAMREEFEQVTSQLARDLGLLGSRHHANEAERARTAVTKAIRRAVRSIGDGDRDLGRHLDASVRTGVFCSYEPADGRTWTVTRS